jgi:hypothetical protein
MITIMHFLNVSFGVEIVSISILTEDEAGGFFLLYYDYCFIYLFAHVTLHILLF